MILLVFQVKLWQFVLLLFQKVWLLLHSIKDGVHKLVNIGIIQFLPELLLPFHRFFILLIVLYKVIQHFDFGEDVFLLELISVGLIYWDNWVIFVNLEKPFTSFFWILTLLWYDGSLDIIRLQMLDIGILIVNFHFEIFLLCLKSLYFSL